MPDGTRRSRLGRHPFMAVRYEPPAAVFAVTGTVGTYCPPTRFVRPMPPVRRASRADAGPIRQHRACRTSRQA